MTSLFGMPVDARDIFDRMMPGYDRTKDFWDRPRLPRKRPHPFVQGYMMAMLEEWPFNVVNDISEPMYVAMIDECAQFFWAARDELGELSFIHNVPMPALGKAFWESRSGGFGFSLQDWSYADQLHRVASLKYHPVWVIQLPEDDEHYPDQLSYVWEDPNETFQFDFT